MEDSEKVKFMKLLAQTLASYGKGLPESAILAAWWSTLQPYPWNVVATAMRAYSDENGEFAPVPAGIAMRCKLMDGRPGAEEAWAIALTGQDEASTVVWTTEMAEAFLICRPVLESSGAISARKSFLDAYSRLVAAARSDRRPAEWVASVGWDKAGHAPVLTKAIRAGLLPAPVAAALLAGPAGDPTPDEKARAQLAEIKKMLADGSEAKERARLEAIERQRLEDEEWKRKTNERVRQYRSGGASA